MSSNIHPEHFGFWCSRQAAYVQMNMEHGSSTARWHHCGWWSRIPWVMSDYSQVNFFDSQVCSLFFIRSRYPSLLYLSPVFMVMFFQIWSSIVPWLNFIKPFAKKTKILDKDISSRPWKCKERKITWIYPPVFCRVPNK